MTTLKSGTYHLPVVPAIFISFNLFRWTEDRTWKLVNCILEDAEVRQGLFPIPGANLSVAKGGSKPKSDYHWSLAHLVFGDDPELGQHINAGNVDRKFWQLKIKNKLQK